MYKVCTCLHCEVGIDHGSFCYKIPRNVKNETTTTVQSSVYKHPKRDFLNPKAINPKPDRCNGQVNTFYGLGTIDMNN